MIRSKQSRRRGSKTHGYGSMKKNRGAGNRGGRGNAGSGKRGDANKPSRRKAGIKMGKSGFKRGVAPSVDSIINLGMVQQHLAKFEIEKVAEKKGEAYAIDLGKAGYTKLLAKGNLNFKCTITVDKATPKAIEKVKASGGSIVNLNKDEEPAQ
jgi:large subunit ribosomal protein L15